MHIPQKTLGTWGAMMALIMTSVPTYSLSASLLQRRTFALEELKSIPSTAAAQNFRHAEETVYSTERTVVDSTELLSRLSANPQTHTSMSFAPGAVIEINRGDSITWDDGQFALRNRFKISYEDLSSFKSQLDPSLGERNQYELKEFVSQLYQFLKKKNLLSDKNMEQEKFVKYHVTLLANRRFNEYIHIKHPHVAASDLKSLESYARAQGLAEQTIDGRVHFTNEQADQIFLQWLKERHPYVQYYLHPTKNKSLNILPKKATSVQRGDSITLEEGEIVLRTRLRWEEGDILGFKNKLSLSFGEIKEYELQEFLSALYQFLKKKNPYSFINRSQKRFVENNLPFLKLRRFDEYILINHPYLTSDQLDDLIRYAGTKGLKNGFDLENGMYTAEEADAVFLEWQEAAFASRSPHKKS